MTKLVRYFFGGVLLLIALFGVQYFKSYHGKIIPYPFLFMIASGIVGLIGAFIIYAPSILKDKQVRKNFSARIEELKLNGEKIKVEFKDCEVKDNFYYEEVQKEYSQTDAFFALVGGTAANDKPEVQSRHTAVFVYNYQNPRTGESQRFVSPVIAKDKITLEVLLDMQKQTFLYVNKENAQEYFFDLEFLS